MFAILLHFYSIFNKINTICYKHALLVTLSISKIDRIFSLNQVSSVITWPRLIHLLPSAFWKAKYALYVIYPTTYNDCPRDDICRWWWATFQQHHCHQIVCIKHLPLYHWPVKTRAFGTRKQTKLIELSQSLELRLNCSWRRLYTHAEIMTSNSNFICTRVDVTVTIRYSSRLVCSSYVQKIVGLWINVKLINGSPKLPSSSSNDGSSDNYIRSVRDSSGYAISLADTSKRSQKKRYWKSKRSNTVQVQLMVILHDNIDNNINNHIKS